MENVKDQILIFIKHLGIGQKAFEVSVGISNGSVNNMKGNPTVGTINKIVLAYPQLNKMWLITGEGEMLKTTEAPQPPTNTIQSELDSLKTRISLIEKLLLK